MRKTRNPSRPGSAAASRTIMHNGKPHVLPPAEYEDSPNAYWDAQAMGNGVGDSFYDIGGKAFYPNGPTPGMPSDPYSPAMNAAGRGPNPQEAGGSPGMLPKTIMHMGMPYVLAPAEYEDSPNSYWDAQAMGNGAGTSFYDVGGEAFYPEGQVPSFGQQQPDQEMGFKRLMEMLLRK